MSAFLDGAQALDPPTTQTGGPSAGPTINARPHTGRSVSMMRNRTAVAPYGHVGRQPRRRIPHPARPLAWAFLFTVVPAFWIGALIGLWELLF